MLFLFYNFRSNVWKGAPIVSKDNSLCHNYWERLSFAGQEVNQDLDQLIDFTLMED